MINRKVTIGRDPRSDIRIEERFDTVSNTHAEIVRQGEDLVFIDHSSNGTLINNQKVKGFSVNIYPGDKIYLAGSYELSWNQLLRFFPEASRPTVTRNIHGENRPAPPLAGKATVLKEPAARPGGRPTEQYLRRPESRATDYRDGGSTPYRREEADSRISSKRLTSQSETDAALARWNWGAFLLGWLWAVCHRCYWPLSLFVVSMLNAMISVASPAAGMIGNILIGAAGLGINIYLGLKGSRLAWDAGCYDNLQHFEAKERKWKIAGFIVVLGGIVLFFLVLMCLAMAFG